MLIRKMFRDIKNLKGQFFAIFFMCLLGTFVYSGVYSEWSGMEREVEKLYEETRVANGWLSGQFQDTSLLDAYPDVEKEGRLLMPMQVVGKLEHQLHVYAIEKGLIDQGKLVEGIPYDPEQDGIWLDVSYAQANDLHVGDTISLQTQEMMKREVIRGLIYHPLYVFALKDASSFMPDHTTFGFALISKQANDVLRNVPYNQISIRANQEAMEAMQNDMEDNVQLLLSEDHYSIKQVQEEIAQHRAIGTMLPMVFLLVALLSTMNTMKKVIMNQRLQIGTLKALGFQRHQLYMHYTSHVLFLCVLGTSMGALLGPMILPSIIYDMQKTMYVLPNWKSYVDMHLLWICILIIIGCFLVSLQAVHQSVKEVSAVLLRGNIVQKTSKMKFDHLPYMGRNTFYIKWNLRDIWRNKIRSFLAVFGIMGCSGLLLCSLGLQDSIQYMLSLQYEQLHTYESRIQVNANLTQGEIDNIVATVQGEGGMESNVILQTKDQEKSIPLLVLESTNYIHFDKENTIALPKDGILISRKLAQQQDIQVGDEIVWRMSGDEIWQTSTVEVIVITPLSQGIYTSVETMKNYGVSYQVNTIFSASRNIQTMDGIEHIQYHQDLLETMDKMLETMLVLVGVLILAAFLLGIIVLYNFTSLSFFERTFEIATLKVLGFHNKQAKRINRTQNEILCFVGLLMGLPFGYTLLYFMVSTLSENMDVLVYIQPISYVSCILFTWWMMLLVTAIVNRKIKKIVMVEALKELA